MNADFVEQPSADWRIGDFLKEGFADVRWTEFRAAVAFVKHSGTKHIREALQAFSGRGAAVRIAVGIDAGGTSREGLTDLLEAVAERGSVFVFRNANSSTFHPKVYLFQNEAAAEVLIGSGNLTEGGLFTNYEASVRLHLDRSSERDASLLASICAALDTWSNSTLGLCYLLDQQLLTKLAVEGYVPEEARAWADGQPVRRDGRVTEPSLFSPYPVPAAQGLRRAPVRDRSQPKNRLGRRMAERLKAPRPCRWNPRGAPTTYS